MYINNQINVILVDDETLMISLLSDFMKSESNINIQEIFSDGEELVSYLKSDCSLPDIVILDLKMKKMDGIETSLFLQKNYLSIRIIALSSLYQESNFGFMIKNGVSAFLPKDISPSLIIHVVNEVYTKGRYFSDKQFEVLKKQISSRVPSPVLDSIESLTLREKDVLKLLCHEYSNADIADKLCLSIRTVEGHRNNLYLKTDTKNIVGLIVYAFKNKLVDIDECTILK